MASGFGIARRAPGIGRSVPAKIQLRKLGSIRVPLKHDTLAPVVPDRSSDNNVLINEHRALVVRFLVEHMRVEGYEAVRNVPVHGAVLTRQINVGGVVVGFMNRQTSGIGMVSVIHAAGSRKECLRKLRARAS